MNASQEYSRAKLVEELGELLQLLGKLQAFPDDNHPAFNPGLLKARFEEELADVYAALRYFREQHNISVGRGEYETEKVLWNRTQDKLTKFRVWGAERASSHV